MGIDTSGPAAFTLEVEAPKEMRELLEKHLELKRFRYQPDLQRRELTRLLGATDANVRELIGTLGYFSPTVTVELTDTPKKMPMLRARWWSRSTPARDGDRAIRSQIRRPQCRG